MLDLPLQLGPALASNLGVLDLLLSWGHGDYSIHDPHHRPGGSRPARAPAVPGRLHHE